MKWPVVKSKRTIEEKEGESMVMNVGGRHAPGKRCRFSSKSTAHFTNLLHILQIHSVLYSLQFLFFTHTLQIQSVLYGLISFTVIVSPQIHYWFKGPFLFFPSFVQFSSIYYNLWFSVSPFVSHKMLIRWAMKRTWYACTHCFALCQIGERYSEWGGFACFCGSLNCLSTLCLHPLPQCWPLM